MLSAFARALGQIGDPAFLKVLAKSLLLTLILFACAAAGVAWLLSGLDPCAFGPLDGSCPLGAAGGTLASVALGLLSLWFLFPAIAIGVIGLFSDEIVEAVEARHYPDARGRPVPFRRGLSLSLRSAGRILLWNLIALPFYILLLITGIGPLILFSAVNAVALGRDLGEMVAARHHDGPALAAWLRATRVERALLGLAATWLFLIPFANLLAPLIGAAAATHLFHKGKR
jgi:CysZ protein